MTDRKTLEEKIFDIIQQHEPDANWEICIQQIIQEVRKHYFEKIEYLDAYNVENDEQLPKGDMVLIDDIREYMEGK